MVRERERNTVGQNGLLECASFHQLDLQLSAMKSRKEVGLGSGDPSFALAASPR